MKTKEENARLFEQAKANRERRKEQIRENIHGKESEQKHTIVGRIKEWFK